MPSYTLNIETVLLKRLEELEKQNRRLKQVVALFMIVVSSELLIGAAGLKGRTVEASRIDLKDEAGTTRAILGMRSAGPGLALYDGGGDKIEALLTVLETGPVLGLYDADGTTRVPARRNAEGGITGLQRCRGEATS